MAQTPSLPLNIGRLAEARLRQLAVLAADRRLAPVDQGQVVQTVVATVEAFVDEVLRELIASSGYDSSAFGRAMLHELEDRIYQSWRERHGWLEKGFSISIASSAAAQDLLAVVELRNALVHGFGKLTDRQSRDVPTLIRLEHRLQRVLDVRVERRKVNLASSTGMRAIEAARVYILALDAEARRKQLPLSGALPIEDGRSPDN